jgi:hypothetical protein
MSRDWKIALVVSLLLNIALVVGVATLVASEGAAEAVAPRLHVASDRSVDRQAVRIDDLERRTDDHEAQLQDIASSDVAGALDDLDSRVRDLEDEVGSSFAIEDLSSRVDDTEAAIQDACSASRSAATSAIGSDAFYVFLDFQRAFC